MYFVYILECKDKSLYTGITTDVERRLQEHKDGIGSRYTKAHGAQKIVYTEIASNRSIASKREAEIKKWDRLKKIALIETAHTSQRGLASETPQR
jgi:putative endonuclease